MTVWVTAVKSCIVTLVKCYLRNFGVSGPVILSASSYTTAILRKRPLKLVIDLKPALSEEQLDERVLRDFSEEKNKPSVIHLISCFLRKLIPVIVRPQ